VIKLNTVELMYSELETVMFYSAKYSKNFGCKFKKRGNKEIILIIIKFGNLNSGIYN